MTNEQLRKLDALIDKHVFGAQDAFDNLKLTNVLGDNLGSVEVPSESHRPYSSDMSATEDVLNTMRVYLDFDCYASTAGWKASFIQTDKESRARFTAEHTEAAVAICLAALKARDVDVSEFE